MIVLAIDPGTTRSAFVSYRTEDEFILRHGILPNQKLLEEIAGELGLEDHLAIEMIKSYGNALGDSILETCVWIGRFIQQWITIAGGEYTTIPRKTIVTNLCGNPRAKDSNVRQALIDRFSLGATGGGKTPAVGNKQKPGPLYGIKKDVWSALAVAVTWEEMKGFLQ